jgi:hypothetical protein
MPPVLAHPTGLAHNLYRASPLTRRGVKRARAEDTSTAGRSLRPNMSWESKQGLGGVKAEAEATSSQAARSSVVECSVEGSSCSAQEVDLACVKSFKELWMYLRRVFPSGLPDKLDAKLVYLDEDGDWMMVPPEGRWNTFRATATKILISTKC